ncbi:MAG: transcriptional regulator BetI [Gammaproteobacteria bacterium]
MGKVEERRGTRTASKEERRAQLIEATIRSIASHGLSDTTMATVAGEAGLSQGIINLHFDTKDRLLLDTLAQVVNEYRQLWESALREAGPSSAEKLAALVEVDFHRSVCDPAKLAVWFAFWSESKARPTYRRLCAERDREYDRELVQLCGDIVAEGGYDVDPELAARALAAITEGLWLDMMVSPRGMSRRHARRTALAYLAHLFPAHFEHPSRAKESA